MSVLERFARTNNSVRSCRERLQMKARPANIQVNDDSQTGSLFGKPRDIIMNQLLSPTIRHFSLDGGSLPFSRRSPSPRGTSIPASSYTPRLMLSTAKSTESLLSDDSSESSWDKVALLSLSDAVRTSLKNDRSLGPEEERLSSFLEVVLKDEERRQPSLSFDVIENARLDKLLEEILRLSEERQVKNFGIHLPLRLLINAAHAKKLRMFWRRRFREEYFMIDQLRCAALVKGGRLKDVSFDNALAYDLGKWQSKGCDPMSELENNLEFEAGHWWLNMACAHRDGIVSSPFEAPTTGHYGITALPLLTGAEKIIRDDKLNVVKYVRNGRSSDMHIPLISQVGRQIRILRGHRLRSIYAPEAGIRYDGLYTIRQYGTRLDLATDTHRLELTLERVGGQKPLGRLQKIPRPSQLDDWYLYEKLEGDKIRLMEGEGRYFQWSLQQEEDRAERDEWKRDFDFRASLS